MVISTGGGSLKKIRHCEVVGGGGVQTDVTDVE